MLHSRQDYNNEGKIDTIPKDEPVFLLRAQDMTAAVTVRFWASLQPEGRLKDMALHHVYLMDRWPVKKTSRFINEREGRVVEHQFNAKLINKRKEANYESAKITSWKEK